MLYCGIEQILLELAGVVGTLNSRVIWGLGMGTLASWRTLNARGIYVAGPARLPAKMNFPDNI